MTDPRATLESFIQLRGRAQMLCTSSACRLAPRLKELRRQFLLLVVAMPAELRDRSDDPISRLEPETRLAHLYRLPAVTNRHALK